MPKAYYNEFDPYAAQWLRNLIKAGLIADGVVDERSIKEVTPDDLTGFTQCHFFAGIGIWSHALRASGWRDSDPVWTGSCPCQPFSAAGRKEGLNDERHLWPYWYELIKKCKPSVIFGEQVSSKDAMPWVDNVQDNLEESGYAFGALDICAAGVGAPHIRQRLFWVGDTVSIGFKEVHESRCDIEGIREEEAKVSQFGTGTSNFLSDELANTDSIGHPRERRQGQKRATQHSEVNRLADTEVQRHNRCSLAPKGRIWISPETGSAIFEEQPRPRQVNGFWGDADWLYCTDGKWRPVRPGSFPLVNGDTNRMGRLRAYGNAINAEVAKAFIETYMEVVQI